MAHFKRIASGVGKLLSCMLAPMVQHDATLSRKSVGMAAVAHAQMGVFQLGLMIARWVLKALHRPCLRLLLQWPGQVVHA